MTTAVGSMGRGFVEVDYYWEHPQFPDEPRTTKVLVPSPLPENDDDFPVWTILGEDLMLDEDRFNDDDSEKGPAKNVKLTPSAVMRGGTLNVLCEVELVDPGVGAASMASPSAIAWKEANEKKPDLATLVEEVNTDQDKKNIAAKDEEIKVVTHAIATMGTVERNGDLGARSAPLFPTRNSREAEKLKYDALMRNKRSFTPGPQRNTTRWRKGNLHIDTQPPSKRFAFSSTTDAEGFSPLTPKSRFLRSVRERRADTSTYVSSVGRLSHYVPYRNGQEDEASIGRWLMGQKQGTASCFDAPSPVPFEVLMNELVVQRRLKEMHAVSSTFSRVKR